MKNVLKYGLYLTVLMTFVIGCSYFQQDQKPELFPEGFQNQIQTSPIAFGNSIVSNGVRPRTFTEETTPEGNEEFYSQAGGVEERLSLSTLDAFFDDRVNILDEGSLLTADGESINFVGSGVSVTNTGGAAIVTIPAGSDGRLTAVNVDAANQQVDFDNTAGADVLNVDFSDFLFEGEIDGSETKVQAGSNVTVAGSGTIASPYIISSTSGGGGGGSSNQWYTTIDGIRLYANTDPSGWIAQTNNGVIGEYDITVPSGGVLDRIAYVTTGGTNRITTNNQTIFHIDYSALGAATSTLNSITPTVYMSPTPSGNTVPVGIGGSPSLITPAASGGTQDITIQGTTNVANGVTRIQLNDLNPTQ